MQKSLLTIEMLYYIIIVKCKVNTLRNASHHAIKIKFLILVGLFVSEKKEKVNKMKNNNSSFGEFLHSKRVEKDLTLRELARRLEVSAPFLSDVEKNRCAPLTTERLEKVALILIMTEDEKSEMYDLVGKQRDSVAPDLPEYIKTRDYVSMALRAARDLDAGEAEWLKFVEELKKNKE